MEPVEAILAPILRQGIAEGTASVDWIFERRSTMRRSRTLLAASLAGLALAASACGSRTEKAEAASAPAAAPKEVAITTSSDEARQLYLKGRDRVEKLKVTDGNAFFRSALEKDPGFALAWLGVANSAATAQEFFDAIKKAVEAAPKATEGEQ